jgi:hypothetical protein
MTMAKDIIKTCVDRVLPPELMVQAAAKAIEENPANAPVIHFSPGVGAGPLPPPFLAVVTGKKWKNDRTLRVRFLDGSPVVQAKLQPFAHQWSDYANITFSFGDDPNAEIRISFQQEGSWSYIGTDALTIPANQPTMNFGWLEPGTSDEEYSRVVIHEFGHALGCIHEHQNPAANIPWDKDAVYRYYMGPPNNWSKAEVDFNLFERYGQDITQFTEFDRESIMLYPIRNEFTIGDFEVGWNTHLSAQDKAFIGTIYPKQEKPSVELTIGASPTEAEIGAHGEEDSFKFTVPAAGRYVVETGRRTDVVMTLYGPDNETKLIAEDDDSGRWTNAKIVAELGSGIYYVRIRHYRPTGTGKYNIWVRAEQ